VQSPAQKWVTGSLTGTLMEQQQPSLAPRKRSAPQQVVQLPLMMQQEQERQRSPPPAKRPRFASADGNDQVPGVYLAIQVFCCLGDVWQMHI